MALKTYADWAEEISVVSTQAEFQNAVIRIEDSSLVTESYDIETGITTVVGDPRIYQGRARIIGVRAGIFSGGESQANSVTLSSIRIQIPRGVEGATEGFGEGYFGYGPFGGRSTTENFFRVKRGVKVFVEECNRNPVLETYVFNITSDMQGSMSAARTFEAALDGDVQIGE